MNYKQLGRSEIRVPPLIFGGNVFGWTVIQNKSFSLLDALLEYKLNFIDTADVYSRWAEGNQGGESETIIGNWLKKNGKRDQVIIATKVGKPMGEGKEGLSSRYIRQAVEDSLRRLQTEYIDLYQSHHDDKSTPLEESLETFDTLIKEGKVRAIGASNCSAKRFSEALKISEQCGLARYESLQPEYNLYDRAGYEQELESLVEKHHVSVISYYALASGFLSGKYRRLEDTGKSLRGKDIVDKYLNPRGFEILKALDKVAGEHYVTPTEVALAWQMARPSITAPIASATSLEQLAELEQAITLKLEPHDMELLDQASAWR